MCIEAVNNIFKIFLKNNINEANSKFEIRLVDYSQKKNFQKKVAAPDSNSKPLKILFKGLIKALPLYVSGERSNVNIYI
ncbi:hypothetical protein ccbrp13_47710 [Ktedonobacteria bacterium brp13]|nr:hypothetical protein ccbrp13_47710 [Ktedonobacteria bacterium brp13]